MVSVHADQIYAVHDLNGSICIDPQQMNHFFLVQSAPQTILTKTNIHNEEFGDLKFRGSSITWDSNSRLTLYHRMLSQTEKQLRITLFQTRLNCQHYPKSTHIILSYHVYVQGCHSVTTNSSIRQFTWI